MRTLTRLPLASTKKKVGKKVCRYKKFTLRSAEKGGVEQIDKKTCNNNANEQHNYQRIKFDRLDSGFFFFADLPPLSLALLLFSFYP